MLSDELYFLIDIIHTYIIPKATNFIKIQLKVFSRDVDPDPDPPDPSDFAWIQIHVFVRSGSGSRGELNIFRVKILKNKLGAKKMCFPSLLNNFISCEY